MNISCASRKDFRDSVSAARKAVDGWKNKTAYNRGQILYRMGEMMEGRKKQLIQELCLEGLQKKQAELEVNSAIDLFVYYAGWADKYQQVFSRVNPVAQPYFSFTMPEPTGVVSVLCSDNYPLKNAVSILCSVIVSGNTTVLLYSESNPLTAITLAEIVHTSDVPDGVVNVLTGYRKELLTEFASHMDVNAIIYCGEKLEEFKEAQELSSLNLKRCIILNDEKLDRFFQEGPYTILRTVEMKTTWHPVGV
tara:strand:+ start:3130 stop:3879 length:750 start_codon:yes stop_codon:yes gene_type:complete